MSISPVFSEMEMMEFTRRRRTFVNRRCRSGGTSWDNLFLSPSGGGGVVPGGGAGGVVNHRGCAARLDRRISFLGQLAPSMTYGGGGPGAAVELVGSTLRHLLFTAILLLAMLNELTNVGLVPAVKHTGKCFPSIRFRHQN